MEVIQFLIQSTFPCNRVQDCSAIFFRQTLLFTTRYITLAENSSGNSTPVSLIFIILVMRSQFSCWSQDFTSIDQFVFIPLKMKIHNTFDGLQRTKVQHYLWMRSCKYPTERRFHCKNLDLNSEDFGFSYEVRQHCLQFSSLCAGARSMHPCPWKLCHPSPLFLPYRSGDDSRLGSKCLYKYSYNTVGRI